MLRRDRESSSRITPNTCAFLPQPVKGETVRSVRATGERERKTTGSRFRASAVIAVVLLMSLLGEVRTLSCCDNCRFVDSGGYFTCDDRTDASLACTEECSDCICEEGTQSCVCDDCLRDCPPPCGDYESRTAKDPRSA